MFELRCLRAHALVITPRCPRLIYVERFTLIARYAHFTFATFVITFDLFVLRYVDYSWFSCFITRYVARILPHVYIWCALRCGVTVRYIAFYIYVGCYD